MKMYNCFVTINRRDKARFVVAVLADSDYEAYKNSADWCLEHFKKYPFDIDLQPVFEVEFE